MVTKMDRCFVIAEAGVNHNGSLARALELVDIAAAAGADAIKFQTFNADRLASEAAPKAEYQKRETGEGNQRDMLKALELTEEMHDALFARCSEKGIEFMSTPFDAELADFLVKLGVRRLKLPSGEITNKPFIQACAAHKVPLIVSTGMADLEEVCEAVGWIDEVWPERDAGAVTILHCTSNYPAEAADANLAAMKTLADRIGLAVGYSDHTMGIAVPTAAVALGAVVIEKHFTVDRNLPGPDHKASLEPDELKALVSAIRTVEAARGDGIKAPKPSELPVRAVARRSLAATANLAAGHVLTRADLAILRPGTGIAPKHLEESLGRVLKRSVERGVPIQWEDLA
jgi:N-acetylneuraminate synthase